MIPERLSYSAATKFDQCPRAWAFKYVEKRPTPPSFATALGSFVHSVLELVMADEPEERTVDQMRAHAATVWGSPENAERLEQLGPLFRSPDGIGRLRATAWWMLKRWREVIEDPTAIDVVGLEERYSVEIGGVPFVGLVDRLDREGGALVVVDYKGLALDTPIPTPTGWTTMGAIQIGDQVIGSDGRPTPVTGKSAIRDRPCYRVRFDDGSDIVCDDEHRWPVRNTRTDRRSVMTTAELARALGARTGQRLWVIDNASPIDLPEAHLPLDPYLLGTWLGDGTRRRTVMNLSVQKMPIVDAWRKAGFIVTVHAGDTGEGRGFYVRGLRPIFRQMGLDIGNKFIPDAYMRASAPQRLELLRGLMDTDGSWNETRRQVVFVSVDKQLAADVYELVVSLGWRASRHSHDAHGFGLTVTAHTVSFTPFGANPFRHVVHKWEGAESRIEGTAMARRRVIKRVEPMPTVPTQCIAVENSDHTYLCGEQMVPTHNTGKPRDTIQGLLYAAAVEAATGELPTCVRMVYLRHRTSERLVTGRSVSQAVLALRATWDRILVAVEAQRFPTKVGPLCEWCEHVEVCAPGQAQVRARLRAGRVRPDAPALVTLRLPTPGATAV